MSEQIKSEVEKENIGDIDKKIVLENELVPNLLDSNKSHIIEGNEDELIVPTEDINSVDNSESVILKLGDIILITDPSNEILNKKVEEGYQPIFLMIDKESNLQIMDLIQKEK